MSAECNRCGWDLPYEGDCIACDENGTFKNQLVDAKKEATRLSNYETSYNNLQRVVNRQYRNIDALTGELAEARRATTLETTKRLEAIDRWDKTFREMEGLAQQVLVERNEARREVTRLTEERNEERDNHDLVVGAYGSRTGQLQESLREAREHWERCEEGWNKVIKQAEDFQRERDEAHVSIANLQEDVGRVEAELVRADTERQEAQETIDGMREEGCAAAGVLENIFNGVTAEGVNHGDPTIAKTASVAADALVNVPLCEHKEELEEEKGLTDTAIRAMEEAERKLAMCLETLRDADEVKDAALERASDLEPPDPGDDPDRKYDEERDRRMLDNDGDLG